MPMYEYRCPVCNENFTVRSPDYSSTGQSYGVCPRCWWVTSIRVFTVPSVIYKGNGFYSTAKKEGESN